jgi:hypothetical protein
MNFHDLLVPKQHEDYEVAVLATAGIDINMFQRFRAAWFEDGLVHVRTRTGGGNRECFADNDDCSECYHTANEALAELPNFVSDDDDDFDSTYAVFKFKPLPEFEEVVTENSEHMPTMGEATDAFIARVKGGGK